MAWKRSSPESVAAFEQALPLDPRVEQRRMFGCPVGLVRGKMFALLWQDIVAVRVSEADGAALREAGGEPFSPLSRKTSSWISVPESLDARAWVLRALEHVGSSAAKKKPKPRAKRSTAARRRGPRGSGSRGRRPARAAARSRAGS